MVKIIYDPDDPYANVDFAELLQTNIDKDKRIAELEAQVERLKLDDTELNEIKADAIREMGTEMLSKVIETEAFRGNKPTSFKNRIIIATLKNVLTYAENLEKSDE